LSIDLKTYYFMVENTRKPLAKTFASTTLCV